MNRKAENNTPAELSTPAGLPLGGILLAVTTGFLLVLGARSNQGQTPRLADLLPFLGWALSSVLLVAALRIGSFRGSRGLVGLALLLAGLGVLVRSRIEGAAEQEMSLGLLAQPLGMVWLWLAWAVTRKGRTGILKPFAGMSYLLSLAIVAAVMLLGNRFRGAMYGPGGMTPTELLKLFVPLALTGFFASDESKWKGRTCLNPPVGGAGVLVVGTALLAGLLVLQRDLGLVVLLGGVLVVMLVTATRSWSWGVLAAGVAGAGGWAVIRVLPHGARRIEAWLNPFADSTGSGWQVLQGLSGLYAGGLVGTGLGGGRPDRVPIAGSDFVYAVIGEELGYLGCLLVLALFGLILRECRRISSSQRDVFSFLLGTGLTAALAVQILVNIAGVVGLLPVTGITLPYISQGGSSYWVTSVQFGLLLGLSDRKKKKGGKRRGKTEHRLKPPRTAAKQHFA